MPEDSNSICCCNLSCCPRSRKGQASKGKYTELIQCFYLKMMMMMTEQVNFNSTTSNIEFISSSEPKGTILGSLLFIICIKDFLKSLKYNNNLSFANDKLSLVAKK